MERVWCNKSVKSLSEKQKDEILNIVFDACADNDLMEDIGGEIFESLSNKKYIWSEECED